eukprot:4590519-Alexandrium_andersonii.AAC.1
MAAQERALLWMTRFKPTLAREESEALARNLPPDFIEQQAARLECPVTAIQVLAVLELPDAPLARECTRFQNEYIKANGPAG